MQQVAPGTSDPGSRLLPKRFLIERFGVKVGPVAHLAAERARLQSLTWQHFDVRPMSPTIGGLITGVNLADELPQPVVDELRKALCEYKVLFLRDQPITSKQHVAFARRFGELEVHPFLRANEECPEIVRFEKTAETGGFENGWHSDVSWRETPSMGAILHAFEVPNAGGDTLFADMYAAYEGLDAQTQSKVDNLVAIHDYASTFGAGIAREKRAAMREQYPPVQHPVVRTHDETGRKLLYVNRFFTEGIVGMEEPEASAFIHELASEAETVEYQCRFSWEPHSVAFWDNRAVQHYAASDYYPERRVVERASIIGSRPR